MSQKYRYSSGYEDSLTIDSLYNLADSINNLKNLPTEYKVKNFLAYGIVPEMPSNLNIPIHTVRTVSTLEGDIICTSIPCRLLPNIQDLDGKDIYEASNKVLFVYVGIPTTNPRPYFDFPRLTFSNAKVFSEVFREASRKLVDNIPLQIKSQEARDIARLKISNKITELQEKAYSQGIGQNLIINPKN